jgi:hypothetical protein
MSAALLFGVGDDGENDIFIALDLEIKAPVARYPTLPHIERFAVLLGMQGRMITVLQQEAQLLGEGLSDERRHPRVVLVGLLSEAQLHERRFLAGRFARASSAATASRALS